jgi:hypothetical protein
VNFFEILSHEEHEPEEVVEHKSLNLNRLINATNINV